MCCLLAVRPCMPFLGWIIERMLDQYPVPTSSNDLKLAISLNDNLYYATLCNAGFYMKVGTCNNGDYPILVGSSPAIACSKLMSLKGGHVMTIGPMHYAFLVLLFKSGVKS
eukprot:Gb_24479 [translate_table: standard]